MDEDKFKEINNIKQILQSLSFTSIVIDMSLSVVFEIAVVTIFATFFNIH